MRRPAQHHQCTCGAANQLEAENEDLRQSITMLRSAITSLSDAVGALTAPTIPNN